MFTELLPTKLVRGQSAAGLSGFCFVHSITAGIKDETEAANSPLQAAKAALTAELIISCLVASSVSAAFFSTASFTFSSMLTILNFTSLRRSVQREALHYVQGPVEMSVPLGPHRRLRR